MAKEAGEIVRYEPAPEPMAGAAAIAVLSLVNVVFILLFTYGLASGLNAPKDQQVEAFWLAGSMTATAAILAIYRRWFLPDLLIVKKRRNKFEDL
ncbi:MAG: hypothetical protein LC624_05795 [Halobacteriales archaeon]|nr:hypothetical protein [Halobacteriales archaeon]